MYVDLPNHGRCKLGVKYHYRQGIYINDEMNVEKSVQEPYATSVYLTTESGDKFEGYAEVQGPDKFSRLEGRKWGLVSLTKRDTENKLTPLDRECLFKALCPKYFGLTRKQRKELTHEQKPTETVVFQDRYIVKSEVDWWFSIVCGFLGLLIAWIATSLYYEMFYTP